MAKRKKLKYRRQVTRQSTEIASTEFTISPNSTLDPDAALQQPSSAAWLSPDSTSAPDIRAEPEAPEPLAETTWALLDKYLFAKKVLPFTLLIGFIGWIIIQDNKAGKLINWDGIWWMIQKCGVVLGIFLLLLFLQWLYQKLIG